MHLRTSLDRSSARLVILVAALAALGFGCLVATVTGESGETAPEVRGGTRRAPLRTELAGSEGGHSRRGARASVSTPSSTEHDAESLGAPSAGVCVLRVEAPSAIDLELAVDFIRAEDGALAAFRRTHSPRVLDDWVETLWLEWEADPGRVEVSESDVGSQASASVVDGRLAIEWRVADLPTGERLAVVAYPGSAGGFRPFAVELEPLSPGAVTVVELPLEPHGALLGRVELPPGSDPDDFCEVELHPPPSDAETPWSSDETQFRLSNLRSGSQPIAALTANEDTAWRRQWSAQVHDGRVTQLAPWRLALDPEALRIRVVDPEGRPVEGLLSAEFTTGARTSFDVSARGELLLRGDWSGLERVRFEPECRERLLPTWAELPSRAPAWAPGSGLVELVCAARTERRVHYWLRAGRPGTGSGEERDVWSTASWARARRAAGQPWEPVLLGYVSGCMRVRSSEFESGWHEILAWIPHAGLACQASIVVPSSPLDEDDGGPLLLPLDLRFEDPATRVCGTLVPQVRGEAIWASLRVAVYTADELRELDEPTSDIPWGSARLPLFASGPFELRGLPPEVELVLIWFDAECEVARQALRLRRGETLDLGTLTIDCR